MAFRAACPACNDAGEYDLLHSLKQTELGWQLFCELCGESLIHFSTEEKEQIFKAMQLTKEYVPDVINAYSELNVKELSSRVAFGAIAKKETEDKA